MSEISFTNAESILYSLYISDGTILGKTRLNKFLARLQRDGFPVKNKFVNAAMGPYDSDIDLYTSKLDEEGFISKSLYPLPRADYDREDFQLTEDGYLYVEQRIVPTLKKHPFYDILINSIGNISDEYRMMQIDNLVERTHDELYINNTPMFLEVLNDTVKMLNVEFKRLEDNHTDFCYVTLTLLGSLEFAIRSLNRIQIGKWNEPTMGKNNVLYNSKKLLETVRSLLSAHVLPFDDCSTSERCLFNRDCLSSELNTVKYNLHCIEWNSNVYGILKPFDNDYEFTEYMTDEEELQFALQTHLQTPKMTVL